MKNNLESDAESGNPYACLAIAYFMQTGKEMDQDIAGSISWYERAADLGCARAHWELSKLYTAGEYVQHDDHMALKHMMRSAEIGNADAQMALADEYLNGGRLEKDPEAAFRWYMKAAEQGLSAAKFQIGYMFGHGIGTQRSDTEAEMWFSSAGLTGNGDFFLDIGMAYEYGLNGINHNEVEAARWYKYGVDMGHERCTICWNSVMASLGGQPREPLEDRIRRLDDSDAKKEMAAREDALAEADRLLDTGDIEGAFDLYARASDMGSPQAMFAQAMMFHNGIGVKRDDFEAIRLLSRAADAGSEDAEFYLARTYESNRFPTDDSQIVKLYADAAYNGFLAAYYYLSKYVDHPEVYARRTHTRR